MPRFVGGASRSMDFPGAALHVTRAHRATRLEVLRRCDVYCCRQFDKYQMRSSGDR